MIKNPSKSHSKNQSLDPITSQTAENSFTGLRQKVLMYACLVPVFGCGLALMTLISDRSSKQLKELSQVAMVMVMIWLAGYGMAGDGGQIGQELYKGTLTSAYFVLNMYFMVRLSQNQKISLPRLNRSKKSGSPK
jgi:hypothetical protein